MKKREKSLTDRVFNRLVRTPSVLGMSQFSERTPQGTTFCLGGLILDESNVILTYDLQGRASGLAKGQRAPSPFWINHELVQLVGVDAEDVLMPAKAREIWAAEHGEYAGKLLPLYAEDWETGMTYDRVTAIMVLDYLNDVRHGLHVKPMPTIAKAIARVVAPFYAVA